MYYPDYNPSLHDVYLYGPSNTGYPIGLNPNCLIYGASGDYRSLSLRSRGFNFFIGTPIPPGTPNSLLSNYYNINSPLFVTLSDKSVGTAVHFTANKSSASISYDIFKANWTGTTTAYPIDQLLFWNQNFSGVSSYGPWIGAYNHVPLDQITGPTSYYRPNYFVNSPEINGPAGLGGTFYKIWDIDNCFMDLLNSGPTLSHDKVKFITPEYIIKEMQQFGYTAEFYTDVTAITVTIQTQNVFFWDGMDKIIPTRKLRFATLFSNNFLSTSYINASFILNSDPGVGDSSGQIVYLKNSNLFFLGQANVVGNLNDNGIEYPSVQGPRYIGNVLPTYNGWHTRNFDKKRITYAHSTGVTLATQIDFDRAQNKFNDILNRLNILYNTFTN